jgi:hypothetical protein
MMAGEWTVGARLGRDKPAPLQNRRSARRPKARRGQKLRSNLCLYQCPRQDSNLRSRLRRGMLYDVSTWRNASFPADWGAYGERQGTNPAALGGATSSTGVRADGPRIVVTSVVE